MEVVDSGMTVSRFIVFLFFSFASMIVLIACSHVKTEDTASSDPAQQEEAELLTLGELDSDHIDQLMDNWHLAATNADAQTYFGLMAKEAIYLGTDKTERWTKEEFMGFATPYFDKGKAWSFSAHDRHITIDPSGEVAWLDEQLDTWMGPCRGSAVLVLKDGNWLITHYDLSYMVDNDQMDAVIKLTESAPPRE